VASVNKVILVGNLARDPELRNTTNGNAVCNFTVATTDSWKDKESGEKQEKTEWNSVVAWGKLAEVCGKYLHKGKQVYIEGKLQTRKWKDKEDNDKYTTETVAHTMQMLGRRDDPGATKSEPAPEPSAVEPDDDDDLPF